MKYDHFSSRIPGGRSRDLGRSPMFQLQLLWKVAQFSTYQADGWTSPRAVAGWCWLEHVLLFVFICFPIQLGISSSQLTKSYIFQSGRYTTNQVGTSWAIELDLFSQAIAVDSATGPAGWDRQESRWNDGKDTNKIQLNKHINDEQHTQVQYIYIYI